jgi:hypothetical protein
MCTPAGYIEINRRFSKLDISGGREELASSSYMGNLMGVSQALGWNELLKERLVIVLGEPGSGKSWEFQGRSASLRKSGSFAFLIELERLVYGTFGSAFSPADYKRFGQWQRGKETAYFFLDSVVEAKIRRQTDFYDALDKVADAIVPDTIDRTRVVISSRISEWQPETDRHEVLLRFGAPRTRNRQGATGREAAALIVPLGCRRPRRTGERRRSSRAGL